MCDCRETNIGVVRGKECVLVDEEYIYGRLNILLELYQLAWDLDHALNKSLCVPLYSVPFHFEN